MAIYPSGRVIDITAGGGTATLLPSDGKQKYFLKTTGTVTLAADWTITADGTTPDYAEFPMVFLGSVILNGHNFTIFGNNITSGVASNNFEVTGYKLGGSLATVIKPSINGNANLGTTDITDKAVTVGKMADLASGSILVGVSNRPAPLDISADSVIPMGQAGGVVAANVITGVVDVDKAGNSTFASKVITNADISDTAGIEVKKLEAMTDGQVITGNTGAGSIAQIKTLSSDGAIANTGALTIQTNAITPSKESANANTQSLPVYLDFALSTGKFSITMGDNFTLTDIWLNLDSAAANNISVAMDINGTPVTGGVVSFTAADPANTNNQGTAITANASGSAGDVVNFIFTLGGAETATASGSLIYQKQD